MTAADSKLKNPDLATRIDSLDWALLETQLDAQGFARTGAPVLTPQECAELVSLYSDERRFRSRVEMERYRFGAGEYKYLARPLPDLIELLRVSAYPHLVDTANRWASRLGKNDRYPNDIRTFLDTCHRHGQARPTPLMLRYEAGDYNCLHQDLYGDIAFPLQMTCVLSSPGDDFSGGEFLLVEQRPRSQSRGTSISLTQGELIIFANSHRPVGKERGFYRVNMKHGVSAVTSGVRYSLGIIFHDAK